MTYHGHETEPRRVETFAVIDLDRTLLDTPVLVDVLLLQLHDHGFKKEQVQAFMDEIHEQAGRSLSLGDFFERSIPGGLAMYATVKQEILQLAETEGLLTDELLHQGSSELLDTLDGLGVPFAVLTYGNAADQDFKLTLTRTLLGRRIEELHATVTSESEKARWIAANWKWDDGMHIPEDIYAQEPIVADTVVVIDDKLHNLRSDDDKVKGIMIDNTGTNDDALTITDIVVALHDGVSLDQMAVSHDVAA